MELEIQIKKTEEILPLIPDGANKLGLENQLAIMKSLEGLEKTMNNGFKFVSKTLSPRHGGGLG